MRLDLSLATYRIDEAGDENEVWKVAKDIINPNNETEWSMNVNNKKTEDKEEIANAFNTHFVEKINNLKANIDPNLKEDPLLRLKNAQTKSNNKVYLLMQRKGN